MKVIHICGTSGSGKTTLIRSLIPLLLKKGRVAVVKHLGHHLFFLPEGKDTTLFLEAGAMVSAGIDSEKTVFAVDTVSLGEVLDILCFSGVSFAIVEGFKSLPLPKVAMGTKMSAENVILENPGADEIVNHLDRFPDYFPAGWLSKDMGKSGLSTMTGILPAGTSLLSPSERREFYDRFSPMINDMSRNAAGGGADSLIIRIHLHRGLFFGGEDKVLFAVGGPLPEEVLSAFLRIRDGISRSLETALSAGR